MIKILLISIGTRGDMEPFLAIGEMLREKGQQVICAFPEQFRELAEDANMEFHSLGMEFIELLESDIGKTALGGSGSGWAKFLANIKLAQNQTDINKQLILRQYEIVERELPDRILYNGKAIYPILWGLTHTGQNILLCPVPYMHYVKDHTHVAFNNNFGPFLNRLTYALADFGLTMTAEISARWLHLSDRISRSQIKEALLSNKAMYTVSPSLFPRPDYWNENHKVVGYYESSRMKHWEPGEALLAFLRKHRHERMLLVTFGSMMNPEPLEKTKIILEILERHRLPAIINTASGGLVEPDEYDSGLIHFVTQIPYSWILPRVYGVIHHGGSGTTHAALKHGCATLIIPHIIDQFVWNKRIYESGAGPEGERIERLSLRNLEPKILALVHDNSYKESAMRIADQMKEEDSREEVYRFIVEA